MDEPQANESPGADASIRRWPTRSGAAVVGCTRTTPRSAHNALLKHKPVIDSGGRRYPVQGTWVANRLESSTCGTCVIVAIGPVAHVQQTVHAQAQHVSDYRGGSAAHVTHQHDLGPAIMLRANE